MLDTFVVAIGQGLSLIAAFFTFYVTLSFYQQLESTPIEEEEMETEVEVELEEEEEEEIEVVYVEHVEGQVYNSFSVFPN